MTWVLMAYEKHGDAYVSETRLPGSIDDDVIKGLIGDYPNLRGDSFPISSDTLNQLVLIDSRIIVSGDVDYFVEFRQ